MHSSHSGKPPRCGNPKRKILVEEEYFEHKRELIEQSEKVKYDGKPEHKSNPGDFRLKPPREPRSDKTLCDKAHITHKAEALELLKEAFVRGLVDQRFKDGWPRHVWAVKGDDVLEGKPSGGMPGTYHGYPLQEEDPFREKVCMLWRRWCPQNSI